MSSFNLPHAYIYGDRRAKVPNILQDERIYGQSGGDPADLAGRGGPRPSTGTGGEVPITCAKGSDTSATNMSRLLPAAPEALSWPARRSLGGGSRLYSISERSVSRLPLKESSSSVSPAWSKHRRQSPLFRRNAVSHRGHSSDSCVIAGQISEAIVSHSGGQIVGAHGKSFTGLLRTGREHTAEVAEFILNVSRILHCPGHFIAQQPAIALAHVIK